MYEKELEDVNKIINDAKKTRKNLQEKNMGMTFKQKFIIDNYSIPIIIYITLTSLISSISLTFWYLDITNNIKYIKLLNMSLLNNIIFFHILIGICFFFIIFQFGLLFVGVYGYGYHIEKTIKEK